MEGMQHASMHNLASSFMVLFGPFNGWHTTQEFFSSLSFLFSISNSQFSHIAHMAHAYITCMESCH